MHFTATGSFCKDFNIKKVLSHDFCNKEESLWMDQLESSGYFIFL